MVEDDTEIYMLELTIAGGGHNKLNVLDPAAMIAYDFLDFTPYLNSMGFPSIRVSPREKDIGFYKISLYWAEIYTNELYFIQNESEVEFTKDTAADAAITEFEGLLNAFLEGLKVDIYKELSA